MHHEDKKIEGELFEVTLSKIPAGLLNRVSLGRRVDVVPVFLQLALHADDQLLEKDAIRRVRRAFPDIKMSDQQIVSKMDCVGPRALLIVDISGQQHKVVEDSDELSATAPRRWYKHYRPTPDSQMHFVIQSTTVEGYQVLERFEFVKTRDGNLEVPAWVAKRHPDVKILQTAGAQ